jgi:hypothetical protein
LLASLTFDPDEAAPLADPGPRDVLVCGAPRSGTALLTAMLFQPPSVVSVMEPWDALRLPPAELFGSLRDELRGGELARGRLDVDALRAASEVAWVSEGAASYAVRVDADTVLAVKFPCFWRYLPFLPHTRFLVCLRDPVDVVRSCAATDGRLASGLDYDVAFNRDMNARLSAATSDERVRRVLMYDYVYDRVLPYLDHPRVLAVRYERWFTDPLDQLAEIGRFLDADLGSPLPTIRPQRPRPWTADDDFVRAASTTGERMGYP